MDTDTTPIIEDPNPNTNKEANLELDHRHSSMNSHGSPAFLLHNGLSSSQFSGVEMITIQSVSYTSLKDLLTTSTPAAITSPTKHNSSWHEIPIKNPLVKHAALAYLQPMSSPVPEAGGKGFFGWLKARCCGDCGCVSWLYDVVWRIAEEAFWEGPRDEVDDDYYDDDKVE